MKRFFPYARKAALTGVCLVLALAAPPVAASLSITPTLVTIEGRDRYADVHLVNPTDQTSTYEIRWRFFKMEERTGNYVAKETSVTDWDLAKHLVFTPRRVTIEPRSAQKVRLGLRLAGEPPAPGDYRAHLEFMKIPDPEPINQMNGQKQEKAEAAVGVKVNVGFSIPIIYRVGESKVSAKIGQVTIKPENNKIEAQVEIIRSDSPYGIAGDLTLLHNGEVVGQVKNANIFPEIQTRVFNVPLMTNSITGGNLEVIYGDFDPKKNLNYDRKIITIGK